MGVTFASAIRWWCKMEQTIYAHAGAVVEQILVTTGQVVAPGQTLVRISGKETV